MQVTVRRRTKAAESTTDVALGASQPASQRPSQFP